MQENSSHSDSAITISEPQAESLESSIFPRSAWNSQVALLRVLFKVKRALDKIEGLEH